MKEANLFSNFEIIGSYINTFLGQYHPILPLDATVLVTGETGTGKELVARWLHYEDKQRSHRPFVKISIPNIGENIFESEIFGYEKGAFTGAIAAKKGLIEVAEDGTIFLDEIENASPSIQSKLLQLLEDRAYRKVGGTEYLYTQARFIIATNIDLPELVKDGKFRKDLYYRLAVLEMHLPPLIEREDDILTLANYYIEKFNAKMSKNIKPISRDCISYLKSYHWPGNIRELKNFIEKAVVFAVDNAIDFKHMPRVSSTLDHRMEKNYKKYLIQKENEFFHLLYQEARGNVDELASTIDMSKPFVYKKLKEHGIT